MSETRPDDVVLAGEYALGLLDEADAAVARRRAAAEPGFAALVAEWERQLAGLGEALPGEAPPAGLKARIDAALFEGGAPARVPPPAAHASRSLRAWQAAAAALAALAALEFGLLLLARTEEAPTRVVEAPVPVPEADPLVAALVPSGAEAPVVVSLDVPAGVLRVDPSGIEADGRAVQLWLLPPGGGDPVSLGLLVPNTDNTLELQLGPLAEGELPSLAISLEPEGGSPTGSPTGPVIASGAVRRL